MGIFSFLSSQKPKEQKYLGLFFKEGEGIVFIINKRDGTFRLEDKERFTFSNGWEYIIEDVDEALIKLEDRTHESINNVIFFVYSHFIDEHSKEIKKLYLQKIKELVKSLELKALGYIECYEAVQRLIEKKEESPLTAIVIELDATNVGVFVSKGGRLEFSKIVARTNNLIEDLLQSFEELKGRIYLPSRIILYNSQNLDRESTRIVTHKWNQDLFIQPPKVEIISENQVIEGLIQVFEEQIISENKEQTKEQEEISEKEKEVMGFAINQDVKSHNQKPPVENKSQAVLPLYKVIDTLKNIKIFSFANILATKQLVITAGIIIIGVSLFLNEYFVHKATLTIYMPVLNISKTSTLLLSQQPKGEELRLYVATFSALFNETKGTTGKKEIGEKSKGEIAIQNFSLEEKNFKKGTIITASGIKFLFDEDTIIPAGAISGDVLTPGKTKSKVTAQALGEEANVNKGQQFKIEDPKPDLYRVTNETAFSGGTKKTVKTVSKKDMDELQNTIITKAKLGKQNETSQIEEGGESLKDLSQVILQDVQYSREVGEEANEVSLKAKVNTIVYYFKSRELKELLFPILAADLEKEFSLSKEIISYNIDKVTKKNNAITLSLTASAHPMKALSQAEVLKKIIGTRKQDIDQTLKKGFSVDGYSLNMKEPLPFLDQWLPFFKRNISLTVTSL